jgi:hypothetical protein
MHGLSRYPKIRFNVVFMRISYFSYRLFVSLFSKIFTKIPEKTGKKRVLIATRSRDWSKFRDRDTGEEKLGEKLYDSVAKELVKRGYEVLFVYEMPESPFMFFEGMKKLILRMKYEQNSLRYWDMKSFVRGLRFSNYSSNVWKQSNVRSTLVEEFVGRFDFCMNFFTGIMVEDTELSKNLLEKVDPDIVMSYGLGGFKLVLEMLAKKEDIPTVWLEYTIADDWKNLMDASFNFSEDPDEFYIAQRLKYDFFVRRGFPKSMLYYTGAPYLDFIYKLSQNFDSREYLQKHGLKGDDKILLYLTGAEIQDSSLIIRCISAVNNQNVQILIKPHPQENRQKYQKFERTNVKVLYQNDDVYEGMLCADLVIGLFSGALVESASLGKLTLSVRHMNPDVAPHLENCTVRIDLTDNIEEIINKALFDKETRFGMMQKILKFKEESLLDGKATERVVDNMEALLRRRGKI